MNNVSVSLTCLLLHYVPTDVGQPVLLGDRITVHFWQRPQHGETRVGGQSGIPAVGTVARWFICEDAEEGELYLVEPNGWLPVNLLGNDVASTDTGKNAGVNERVVTGNRTIPSPVHRVPDGSWVPPSPVAHQHLHGSVGLQTQERKLDAILSSAAGAGAATLVHALPSGARTRTTCISRLIS